MTIGIFGVSVSTSSTRTVEKSDTNDLSLTKKAERDLDEDAVYLTDVTLTGVSDEPATGYTDNTNYSYSTHNSNTNSNSSSLGLYHLDFALPFSVSESYSQNWGVSEAQVEVEVERGTDTDNILIQNNCIFDFHNTVKMGGWACCVGADATSKGNRTYILQ